MLALLHLACYTFRVTTTDSLTADHKGRPTDPTLIEATELNRLTRPDGWARWAAVAARFPLFSARNHLMVLGQRPEAQLLLPPQQWRAVGRWPVRNAEPVRLWRSRPVRDGRGPRTTRMVGGWAPVFDVDQTEGEPLILMPQPAPATPGHAPRGMAAALGASAAGLGFTLQLRSVATGDRPQADDAVRTITADPASDDVNHCTALLLRITTAAAGGTGIPVECNDAVGAAAAAVVWATYHLPAPSAVRPDPGWGTDHQTLRTVLATATDLAGTITATLAAHAVGTTVAATSDPLPPPPRPPALTSPVRNVAHV